MSDKLTGVRVEYSLEVTVNTGNFQNQKPGYKVSADVPDGMHPSEAKRRVQALVESWMQEEVDSILAGLTNTGS